MQEDSRRTDVTLLWNGRPVAARRGESVASALWRAGITTLAWSRKVHRPLGLSGATPVGVLARVNGRPNVRIDQLAATDGLVIEMQNTWPSARFDLLRLAQLLPPKLVYGGFEHGALIPRAGLGYRLAERAMAHLAGVARPADAGLAPHLVEGQRLAVDCLVVGGGPAGITEANRQAAAGATVALVTRGLETARFARAAGAAVPALDPSVRLFAGHELFGVYRDARLMVAAPHDHRQGAVIFDPQRAVLATGRRSVPPLVRGNQLPGVIDAHAALQLCAVDGVMPGSALAVVGTGAETALAERLRALGASVVHVGPVSALTQIRGGRRVSAIRTDTTIRCDALVHAGPWRADPSLGFQSSAEGHYQVEARPLPASLSVIGAAALPCEAIPARRNIDPHALVCPCMDVTAGELYSHIDAGETDPEVLKRLTSCGMGTCQGFPCWDQMLALLAARIGARPEDFARPTHRPPRRAITVAQAAGLAGLVEPEQ